MHIFVILFFVPKTSECLYIWQMSSPTQERIFIFDIYVTFYVNSTIFFRFFLPVHRNMDNWAGFEWRRLFSIHVLLPGGTSKPLHKLVLFCKVQLNFFACIEYRAISTGTEHVFMQTSLTALTLRPESWELLLYRGQVHDLLLIEVRLTRLTVPANSNTFFI